MLVWPEIDASWADEALGAKWQGVRATREAVTEAIEPLRREKIVRSSLEAEVTVPDLHGLSSDDFAEIAIVASIGAGDAVAVERTEKSKCGRCWRHLPEVTEDGDLCNRCETVVSA
jgi:isoleucyl-tRNA synthetase